MINFEYEDVIEYLKTDISISYMKERQKKRLKEVSKFKYESFEIIINSIYIFHPEYELGFWSIPCDQFKTFLRQRKIDNFLKHAL